MKYILITLIFSLIYSCGEYPGEVAPNYNKSKVGDLLEINTDKLLSVSDSSSILQICNQLKNKQATFYNKYTYNRGYEFDVETTSKSCTDETGITKNFKGIFVFDDINSKVSMASKDSEPLLFSNIVDHNHSSFKDFCGQSSSQIPSDYMISTTVAKSVSIVPKSSSKCLSGSSQVCISVATSFLESGATFKVEYEEIFVLSNLKASSSLLVRRDLYKKCEDDKQVEITSQSLN